jgi:glutathione S-transferase
MQLIGMLDSPYVRRVAIALNLLGLKFEHNPVSVFSTFEKFQSINPVVKAPSLVCDDGTVLMDSSLIIEYAEAVARKSLMPSDLKERQHALRLLGLVLAACEKAVQIVYETNLRPKEKQHEPWLTRVRGQLLSALKLLESEVARQAPSNSSQAGLTIAVVWRFMQMMTGDVVTAAEYPALKKFSEAAEQTPAFLAYPPNGPGVPKN